MIKQGHGRVIALRAPAQLATYVLSFGIGWISRSPLAAFATCLICLLAIELSLGRRFGFSPREGSLKGSFWTSVPYRIVGTFVAGALSILLLLGSYYGESMGSIAVAVFAGLMGFAAIGMNLPDFARETTS